MRRNFGYIEKMLDQFEGQSFPLSKKSQRYLWIIKTVFNQQKQMYIEKTHRIKDRIVSLHQPHIRPIVRGKQKAPVEFGAKLGLSLDNGYAHIDNFSWNAYHESVDLKVQVEAYRRIHGYYPELVLADKIYATHENRSYLKERGIRLTAKPLGRPKKEPESQYQKRKRKKENAERNQIEGKFGQGKNGYNLNMIRARLKDTSESWVSCIIFIMNLLRMEKDFLFSFFQRCFLINIQQLFFSQRNIFNTY